MTWKNYFGLSVIAIFLIVIWVYVFTPTAFVGFPELTYNAFVFHVPPYITQQLAEIQQISQKNQIEYSGEIDLEKGKVTVINGKKNRAYMPSGKITYHTHYIPSHHPFVPYAMQDLPGFQDFATIARQSFDERFPIVHFIVTPHFLHVVQLTPDLWTQTKTFWNSQSAFLFVRKKSEKIHRQMKTHAKNTPGISPKDFHELYLNQMKQLGFNMDKYDLHTRQPLSLKSFVKL